MKLYSAVKSRKTGARINTWTVITETPKTYVATEDGRHWKSERRIGKSIMLAYHEKLFLTRLEAALYLKSKAQAAVENAWGNLLAAMELQDQAQELIDEETSKARKELQNA